MLLASCSTTSGVAKPMSWDLGQLQDLSRGVHAIVNLSPDVVGCTKQMADLGRLRFIDDLRRVM